MNKWQDLTDMEVNAGAYRTVRTRVAFTDLQTLWRCCRRIAGAP
jgi:hypothetical protein